MLSDDGRLIFVTSERLLPEDTNGMDDVYTYKDGRLDLVSSGRATSDVRFADATADGTRIYFITRAQLSGWDTDTKADLYVARLGAGLPEPELRPEEPCVGDDCQAPSTAVGSPAITSSGTDGDGNARAERRPARATLAVAQVRSQRGPVARLRVRVPSAGRVAVNGRLVRRVARSLPRGGSYTVPVRLSARAKQRLRATKRLRLRVRVAYRIRGGAMTSKSVRLTFAQPRAKRARVVGGGR